MSLTKKQIYDLNNMNVAAQKAKLGDILNHESSEGGVAIDKTLTRDGEAADAKAVGDKITEINSKLIEATTSKSGLMSSADKNKLDSLNNYSLTAATKEALGGVKQASAVADSSGATDTALETKFNALLASLRTAGILANN